MNLYKFDKQGICQRFIANWKKRNRVTDILLYGVQVAAVLYSLVMVLELVDMVCDFRSPTPYGIYKEMTVGGLLFRMLNKGWLVGLAVCITVFFCNQRLIKWKADGILWMFILFFGISMSTLAVEEEMSLYFSVFSIGPLALYFLSLLLPKNIGETNTTTFQQCCKPANWLITLSFILMLLWSIFLCDIICRHLMTC